MAASVVLMVSTGLLGPSAAQPALPQRGDHPPFWLDADPSPWLVSGLLFAGLAVGAVSLGVGMLALRRGWSPDPRRLLAASFLAVAVLVLVPPMGSADHLSYAAYGRIAALDADPYAVAPERFAGGADPVVGSVERPWRWTPSVYGPLATLEQRLASEVAGASTHGTVFLLASVNALAFAVTGLLLQRLGGGARAALLWSLNPLLLWALVAGAHLDAFAVVWAVAALVVVSRSPVGAGVLLGAAVCVKPSYGLLGLAGLWALRRAPLRALRATLAGGTVAAGAFLASGPHVFDQLLRASRYVSLASPWNLVVDQFDEAMGTGLSRRVIGALALTAGLLVAWLLARALPREALVVDPVVADAVRAGVVIAAAYLLTAAYVLPWYDAMLWAPLALLAPSGFDLVALARLGVLAVAYLPGRVVGLTEGLQDTSQAVRGTLTPTLFAAAGALLAWRAYTLSGRRVSGSAPAPR